MPTGQTPFPGYFDTDALHFAVEIVKTILGTIGKIFGAL
ncbi:hypothetical protein CHEID_07590 [Corynebacterium heidelbergense]|nr:hypothetical protein CHEID_07590 [Corynebacterium heidelbergense]